VGTALTDEELSAATGNAAVAVAFWSALGAGRLDEAADLLDPDGSFWVGGFPPRTEMTMRVFISEFRDMRPPAPEPSAAPPAEPERSGGMHIYDVFNGDGDRVVVEMYNDAPRGDGGSYDMAYIFVFRVRAGRIYSIREYADTWRAITLNGDGQIALWATAREVAPFGTPADEYAERLPLILQAIGFPTTAT
jgi:ketosteroid isomerase-like protein